MQKSHLKGISNNVIPAQLRIYKSLIRIDSGLGSGVLLRSTSSIYGVVRRGDSKSLTDLGVHRENFWSRPWTAPTEWFGIVTASHVGAARGRDLYREGRCLDHYVYCVERRL